MFVMMQYCLAGCGSLSCRSVTVGSIQWFISSLVHKLMQAFSHRSFRSFKVCVRKLMRPKYDIYQQTCSGWLLVLDVTFRPHNAGAPSATTGYRYISASTSRLRRSFIGRCLAFRRRTYPTTLPSCRRCS